ncbi:MAG: EndoU domain-containing protein [Clostridia bacterium]|nr:EndoU domain-containing protein [Clostridia bacterium]
MGTGKCGRYLNTKGSGRSVSDFALVHSNEGTFTYTPKEHKISKLKSGGHGEAGLQLLERHNIPYNIVETYSNGVRIGNVPGHKDPRKRKGTGQAWFPKSWTERDIRRAGEHVAGLKGNRKVPDGKTIFGTYKGVRVGVIRTNGKIATVFPDVNQIPALKRKRR